MSDYMFHQPKSIVSQARMEPLRDIRNRVNIAGVSFDNVTMSEASGILDRAIRLRQKLVVVPVNTDVVVQCNLNSRLHRITDDAGLVLTDGYPIVWASRLLRSPIAQRVAGSDLFVEICKLAPEKGYRLFFLGGRENVASEAANILRKKYPSIDITGTYSPPFGFENDPSQIAQIRERISKARPDIVFVGLGCPKQEYWIDLNASSIEASVFIAVGATFSFITGDIKRAPRFVQRIGLEWTWRVFQEPFKFIRRYFLRDPLFILYVARQWYASLRGRASP